MTLRLIIGNLYIRSWIPSPGTERLKLCNSLCDKIHKGGNSVFSCWQQANFNHVWVYVNEVNFGKSQWMGAGCQGNQLHVPFIPTPTQPSREGRGAGPWIQLSVFKDLINQATYCGLHKSPWTAGFREQSWWTRGGARTVMRPEERALRLQTPCPVHLFHLAITKLYPSTEDRWPS